tara:strand:- start:848 stop:1339 length:492 start_codon:yes stop_codon:yes gene_type:complete
MRDLAAIVLAITLVFFALRLATSLTRDRRQRKRTRLAIEAIGQIILAEVPSDTGITFFTEDATAFYFGQQTIHKSAITATRVLINGTPIAASIRHDIRDAETVPQEVVENHPEGFARDRWDVAIETTDSTVVVPCGAIRERISQELARGIFAAVKMAIETNTK